ncbi:MAG: hypothetical protein V7L22_18835 [Nostoc sp.]|uniref:hypothetical protein n=1 Tax=Nostoc sp. TaxID=1180 RepID=UPI002FF4FAE8
MTEIVAATPPDDSLPDDFDPFEHLQTVYIPQHNAAVKRFFSDLPDDWKPNIATARSSLRTACTMLDNDNQLMMNLRHHLLSERSPCQRSSPILEPCLIKRTELNVMYLAFMVKSS